MRESSSFDIFDTVLTRSVGDPKAVFRLLAAHLAATTDVNVSHEALAATRDVVEYHLLTARQRPPRLLEICTEVARRLDRPGLTAQSLFTAEQEVERRVSRLVPGAEQLVTKARKAGHNVIFTSDTPLPSEFLIELLTQAGVWRDGDRCFASGDRGGSKQDGRLFVAVDRDLKEARVHHVGDDRLSDFGAARLHGWTSQHRPTARLNRYEQSLEAHAKATDGVASRLAGASRMARLRAMEEGIDRPLAEVTAGVAGPLLVAYALWLLQRAQSLGLERLYFVARDGEVLLSVVEPLAAALGRSLECRYLLGSRDSWRYAAQAEERDWDPVTAIRFRSDDLTPRQLCRSTGLTPDRAARLTGEPVLFSLEHIDRPLSGSGRERLLEILRLEPARSEILEEANRQRELVNAYMDQEGVTDQRPKGLVDVGWIGRSAVALDRVLGGQQRRLPDAWLYIGLGAKRRQRGVEPDLRRRQHSFLFDHDEGSGVPFELSGYVSLIELFCEATHGRTVGYERDHERVKPVFASSRNARVLEWGLADLRRTLDFFVDELTSDVACLPKAVDTRGAVWSVLELFWRSPTPEEAGRWGSFPVEADQAAGRRVALAGPVRGADVLRAASRGRFEIRPRHSWLAGTMAVSSRGWRVPLTLAEGMRLRRDRFRRLPRRIMLEACAAQKMRRHDRRKD